MSAVRIDSSSRTKDNKESTYRSLLQQISQGNESALEEFYRAFESRIFAFIQIRLNDFHEAADLLNDVMWEVWRGAGRFEGRSSVSSWVFGIANHKILDRIRSKMRHPTEELNETDTYESDIDLEALVGQKQLGEHLQHCMEKLSGDQRQVVHLAFFEDLSYREIGEISGSPEGTIKARMFHAKQMLKRCLSRRIK
jgi:RNA polymerase sigma-70 factor (ECF subfamily)